MKLTGAQIVMECLLEQGVDTVFGYPGGQVVNIYDALYEYRDRIRHIRTAHEQGAAHAADGYARSTGRAGVCIATSGPGATNLVTGIATAYMDSIPMVAITGNVPLHLLGLDSFQEVDITGITMPITKHNYIVKSLKDLPYMLRKAFAIANSGRKGPVLVDIPKDIQIAEMDFTPGEMLNEPRPHDFPLEERFTQALEMLNQAERPFIYAGGGVLACEANDALFRFANLLDAPVACSLMCQGGYDQTDRRHIGMLGMHGTKASANAIKNCDLLVAVGTRFSDRALCNAKLFAKGRPILQIDIDTAEFSKNIDVDLKMKGDAREILMELNRRLEQHNHSAWMDSIAEWKAAYPLTQKPLEPDAVTPQYLIETLNRLTNPEDIIVTDVGQHQMWSAQFYTYRHPHQFITSGGLGTMGFGLGAAIGAQLANPGKRVINMTGDGCLHMNCNELATLTAYRIPVIEILFNNSVLGMVRQWQKLFFDAHYSQTDIDQGTNYELLAQAFGVKALTIRTHDDVEPVLKEALTCGVPVLVNCYIDKGMDVLPMVPAGVSVEEPILEIPAES